MAFTAVEGRRLVDAHRHGDDGAFPELVRTHRNGLLARARFRLGDDQLAEDAVQECFLRAYRGLPSFGGAGEFHLSAWLYRILENVCIDEANKRQRARAVVERLASQPEELAPDAETAARFANPQVSEAINRLPGPYRAALIQREVEGLTYADIAAASGITEDNARARVSRARSALRRLIGPVVAAYAWIIGSTRRGERVLLEGTTHAAVSTPASAAVVPVSVHIPAATNLLTQVTAAVPESQLVSAIKVATAAVIAVALPVGGVTAVTKAAPPAAAPPAIEVTQSASAPAGAPTPASAGSSETQTASGPSGDEAGSSGETGGTDPLSGAVAAGVDAEEQEAVDEAAETAVPTDEADTESGSTDEAEAPAEEPVVEEPAAGDAAESEADAPSSAVVLDTSTVYRNTLDDGRFELAGPTSFTTSAGTFSGRLTITCAVPAPGDAEDEEYRLGGSLVTTGDNAGRIRLFGAMEAWSVDEDGVTTYVFSGRYQITEGNGFGVSPKGEFTASFRGTGRSELIVRLLPKGSATTTS